MNLKFCNKRHLKVCNRFENDQNCRFSKSCLYFHSEGHGSEDRAKMKEKIKDMESVILEMSQQILNLEVEFKEIKAKYVDKWRGKG